MGKFQDVWHEKGLLGERKCYEVLYIHGRIVVSISACHAEDPGSIPGRGDNRYLAPSRSNF